MTPRRLALSFGSVDRDLAKRAVRILAGAQIDAVPADDGLLGVPGPPRRQLSPAAGTQVRNRRRGLGPGWKDCKEGGQRVVHRAMGDGIVRGKHALAAEPGRQRRLRRHRAYREPRTRPARKAAVRGERGKRRRDSPRLDAEQRLGLGGREDGGDDRLAQTVSGRGGCEAVAQQRGERAGGVARRLGSVIEAEAGQQPGEIGDPDHDAVRFGRGHRERHDGGLHGDGECIVIEAETRVEEGRQVQDEARVLRSTALPDSADRGALAVQQHAVQRSRPAPTQARHPPRSGPPSLSKPRPRSVSQRVHRRVRARRARRRRWPPMPAGRLIARCGRVRVGPRCQPAASARLARSGSFACCESTSAPARREENVGLHWAIEHKSCGQVRLRLGLDHVAGPLGARFVYPAA